MHSSAPDNETTFMARADLAPVSGSRMRGTELACAGLSIFMMLYYFRPEDWVPALGSLRLTMLSGAVTLVGFAGAYSKSGKLARTREVYLFLAMLAWFMALIPFSSWPGGSFKIFDDYIWKIALLSIVFVNVIDTVPRLRRMLGIQALGVTLIALSSYGNIDTGTGRLTGISQAFGNSNDLACMIAMTLPLSVYFIIFSKHAVKLFWIVASLLMIYIIVLTMSRTGFLALMAAIACLAWYFLVKQGKTGLLLLLLGIGAVGFAVAAPSSYRDRVASIFISELDSAGSREDATGSRQARIELLKRSLEVTLNHPIMGLGPGQFIVASGSWHVSHNTYLEFTTECGIPGFIIFLLLLRLAFKNLKEAEAQVPVGYDSQGWVLVGVLRSILITFLVAAFFCNYGYQFFTYFMICYTASLNQIVKNAERDGDEEWDDWGSEFCAEPQLSPDSAT